MAVGKLEFRQMPSATRNEFGQASIGPIGVADQSYRRMRSAISPLAAGAANQERSIGSASIGQPAGTCWHNDIWPGAGYPPGKEFLHRARL